MGNKYKSPIIAILIAVFFTCLFTWPFVTKLSTFYKDAGDYPLNGWIFWHNYLSITSGEIFNQNTYFQTNQFYPLPYSLTYSEHLFLPSLIFSLLFFLTSNLVFSVNTYVFISFVLSFLSMYYVVYFITKNLAASIIGAIVYTFNPLVYAHLNQGHIQLLGRYFLPLVFLFAYRYFQNPSYRYSFLFFLSFTLNALTSIYFLILTTTVLLFFIPVCLSFNLLTQARKRYLSQLAKSSLVFFVFVPILLFFTLPYLTFSQKEGVTRSLAENLYNAARPMDWLFSTPDSLLYGKIAQQAQPMRLQQEPGNNIFNYGEHTLFMNILPSMLFLLGILVFYNKYKRGSITFNEHYLFIGLLIISIISSILTTTGGAFIAYHTIPFLNGIRVPTRFAFLLYIPFAIFVSYGFLSLKKYKLPLLALFIIALIFIENIHVRSFAETSSTLKNHSHKAYDLAFLYGSTTVHLPLVFSNPLEKIHHLNWATITHEKMLNGYSGYEPYDWAQLIMKINHRLDEKSMRKLKALGINFIILHKNLIDKDTLRDLVNDKFYKISKVYEDENVLIVDIRKYRLEITLCDKNKDFSIKRKRTDGSENGTSIRLELINTKDCYLPSKFANRYTDLSYEEAQKTYKVSVKLPLLISPYEKIETQGKPTD